MKNYRNILAAASLLALAGGCGSHQPTEEQMDHQRALQEQTATDMWIVGSLRDTVETNGILTQHTLYPYHFEIGGSALNSLGRRDLLVLSDHYKKIETGELSVRRGDASASLYDARVKHVKDALAEAGLEKERVHISDALPGGTGISSDRVVKILESNRAAAAAGSSSVTPGSNSSSDSSARDSIKGDNQ